MACDHDRRERLLAIRMQGRVVGELWRCQGCGDFLSMKPMSIKQFLSDNPAPCTALAGGALAGGHTDMGSSNGMMT